MLFHLVPCFAVLIQTIQYPSLQVFPEMHTQHDHRKATLNSHQSDLPCYAASAKRHSLLRRASSGHLTPDMPKNKQNYSDCSRFYCDKAKEEVAKIVGDESIGIVLDVTNCLGKIGKYA